MGGNKRKPAASSDKGQTGPAGEIKPAAEEKKKAKPQQRAKLAVVIEENEGMKALNGLKAITIQSFARSAGVKISIANAFIRSLESKGVVKCVGGYSGHKIYEMMKR